MRTQKTPITPESALIKVAALCARSEQAVGDIRTKLTNWGLPSAEVEKVIDRLYDEKYLDDERYARAYCRDKMRFNGWGRIKVAFMLKSKGIGKQHIDLVLSEVDMTQYRATLLHLLLAKYRDVAKKEPMQARAALIRFAASRGFEPDMLYSVVDEVMKDNPCDE